MIPTGSGTETNVADPVLIGPGQQQEVAWMQLSYEKKKKKKKKMHII